MCQTSALTLNWIKCPKASDVCKENTIKVMIVIGCELLDHGQIR